MHLSGGGGLGWRVVHWGVCEQTPSQAATAVEPDVALGVVQGGVVLGDAQGGVAGDVGEESAVPGAGDCALEVVDDKHNFDEGGKFLFESSSCLDCCCCTALLSARDILFCFLESFLFSFFNPHTSVFIFL